MSLDAERALKTRREGELRAAAKRLARAALSVNVECVVQRQDLELLLACFALRKTS